MITMKNVRILIDSFLESGYVFHKRPLFFWKNQENHGVFFDFWQRYMVAKKVLLTVCRFSLRSLKNEKNDLEPEIQVFFSFVNLSILIVFWGNIRIPEKRRFTQSSAFWKDTLKTGALFAIDSAPSILKEKLEKMAKSRTKMACRVLYAL